MPLHKVPAPLRQHTASTPSGEVNRERQPLTLVNLLLVIYEYNYHNNKEMSVVLNCSTLSSSVLMATLHSLSHPKAATVC